MLPAQHQLDRTGHLLSSRLIVEPVDRGSLYAAFTAVLEAQKIDRTALLIIIDACNPPEDWKMISNLTTQFQRSQVVQSHVINCAEPATTETRAERLVAKGERMEDPTLFQTIRADQLPEIEETTPAHQVYAAGSFVIGTAASIEAAAQSVCQPGWAASQSAHMKMDTRGRLLWPDFNIWSAQAPRTFYQLLTKGSPHVLLRPIMQKKTTDQTLPSRRDVFEENCTSCAVTAEGHLVAVAGCTDLKVVATKDATLITPRSNQADVQPIIDRLLKYERPELMDFSIGLQPWGKQIEIDRGLDFTTQRVEVAPNCTIVGHKHQHRDETWLVLSGQGTAVINDETRELKAGSSLFIPKSVFHECTSAGNEPLIMLETRHGQTISETDLIMAPNPHVPELA